MTNEIRKPFRTDTKTVLSFHHGSRTLGCDQKGAKKRRKMKGEVNELGGGGYNRKYNRLFSFKISYHCTLQN